jgi:hypothetical protein
MLRNPIERAVSAYLHTKRGGFIEKLGFESALKEEDGRLERDPKITPMVLYRSMGLYYKMVKAYLDNFENVHLILYDDFRNKTKEEVRKVFEFLGVEVEEVDVSTKVNTGGWDWNPIAKRAMYNDNIIKRIYRWVLKNNPNTKLKINRALISFTKRKEKFVLKNETHNELVAFFEKDVRNLSNLINRSLDDWLITK